METSASGSVSEDGVGTAAVEDSRESGGLSGVSVTVSGERVRDFSGSRGGAVAGGVSYGVGGLTLATGGAGRAGWGAEKTGGRDAFAELDPDTWFCSNELGAVERGRLPRTADATGGLGVGTG